MMMGTRVGVQSLIRATAILGTVLFADSILADDKADIHVAEATYKMSSGKPVYGPFLPANGPVVRVFAESGTTYNHIADSHAKLNFRLEYKAVCQGKRRVTKTTFSLGDAQADDGGSEYAIKSGTVGMSLRLDELQGFDPIALCNDHRKTLSLEKGKPEVEIVEKGFSLFVKDVIRAKGVVTCEQPLGRGHLGSDTAEMTVWVSCEPNENAGRAKKSVKTSKARPDAGPTVSVFKSATLSANPKNAVGKCPMTVKFTGSITAAVAGKIEYQLVGDNDYETPVKTLVFDKPGTKAISWARTIREAVQEGKPGRATSAPSSSPPARAGARAVIDGWMAVKVTYREKNDIASTRKTKTTEKISFTVRCQDSKGAATR